MTKKRATRRIEVELTIDALCDADNRTVDYFYRLLGDITTIQEIIDLYQETLPHEIQTEH